MGPSLCFSKQKGSTANDNIDTVIDKLIKHIGDIQQAWLVINQGQHVDAKGALQRRMFIEVTKNHVRLSITFQLDNKTHPFTVRLVTDITDAFNFLVPYQLRHSFNQRTNIDLIRRFRNNNRSPFLTTVATRNLFNCRDSPHNNATTSGTESIPNTRITNDIGCSRKVGPFNILH